MNILMLAPEPFFEPRGTPISVYMRLQLLSRLGHTVTVLTYHLGQAIDVPGVRVARVPNLRFITRVKAGPSWAKPMLDALLSGLALQHLLTGRYDAIHTHEEAAVIGMLLGAVFGKPHIYDMHSSLPRQFANFRFGSWWPLVKVFELLERWVLHTCQAVITVGEDLERIVRRVRPEARVVRLENLPAQAFGVGPSVEAVAAIRAQLALAERVCIVYAGTFEPYQGLDLLLDSAAIVARQAPAALFVWIGGRPDQVQYWRDRLAANGLQRHVRLVGTVPWMESLAYLEAADILVSPRRDGPSTPLKIYTYLLAGKPVVATRSVSHTQVLSASPAVLVEPTPEALAAGILRLTGDSALRQALGAQVGAYAREHFNISKQLDRLAELYEHIEVSPGCARAAPPAH